MEESRKEGEGKEGLTSIVLRPSLHIDQKRWSRSH